MKTLLLFLAMSVASQLPAEDDVVPFLEEVSVTVKADGASGSGTIIKEGEYTFILTASHVVEGLRSTREVIGSDGHKKTLVEFDDAQVSKLHIEDGRTVGKTIVDARVIHYSSSDHNDDVAVLLVRMKNFGEKSAVFAPNNEHPNLGDKVLHVGSFLGEDGANSFSRGEVSQLGRLIDGKVYHQLNLTSFPGSSGGIVSDSKARYIGMLVRGYQPGFVLITPVSRLYDWAERTHFEWLLTDEEMPPLKEVLSLPIEDN